MTGNGTVKLELEALRGVDRLKDGTTAETLNYPGTHTIRVSFSGKEFSYDVKKILADMIHEQAHVWDFAQEQSGRGSVSYAMMQGTGGTEDGRTYHPGRTLATDYAANSRNEDWAEAVTAAVLGPKYGSLDAARTTFLLGLLPYASAFYPPRVSHL